MDVRQLTAKILSMAAHGTTHGGMNPLHGHAITKKQR